MLKLKDKWIWDFWFAQDGADWHIYFLQADRSLGDPELRHRNVSVGHAVSQDLKNWTQLGTCFVPSDGPAFDDFTTWTGSVLQAPDKERRFALAMGCEVKYADQFIYADDLDAKNPDAFEPIGVSCRICERTDCIQRAVPPSHTKLTVDLNNREVLPYRLS